MACDMMLARNQTMGQRKEQVRKAVSVIGELLANRRAQVKVGPQGAVTFTGIPDADRAGITDACVYRLVMQSGSAGAKLAIQRAEQLAGRAVDRRAVARGVHSHDGGQTWSTH